METLMNGALYWNIKAKFSNESNMKPNCNTERASNSMAAT